MTQPSLKFLLRLSQVLALTLQHSEPHGVPGNVVQDFANCRTDSAKVNCVPYARRRGLASAKCTGGCSRLRFDLGALRCP